MAMTKRTNKALPMSSLSMWFFKKVEMGIEEIAEKMGMVAIGVVTIMVFFTTTDVALRYFFLKPIAGVYELTGFMMLICCCLTLAWCAITGKHVKVDVLVKFFNPRIQEILTIFNYLVVMGGSLLIVVQSYKFGLFMMKTGGHPPLLKLPYYPFYFIITLGFCLLFLVTLILLVRSVYKVVKEWVQS